MAALPTALQREGHADFCRCGEIAFPASPFAGRFADRAKDAAWVRFSRPGLQIANVKIWNGNCLKCNFLI
jgi:hypothetical protein